MNAISDGYGDWSDHWKMICMQRYIQILETSMRNNCKMYRCNREFGFVRSGWVGFISVIKLGCHYSILFTIENVVKLNGKPKRLCIGDGRFPISSTTIILITFHLTLSAWRKWYFFFTSFFTKTQIKPYRILRL